MESIIDCYFANIFTHMDRGCLIPRYKRRQIVDYFSTVIRACTTNENYEENCKKAVDAILKFHKNAKENNGSVCLLGKYHNVLYVALKLCFDWRLSDHKTVTTVLMDLFSCEKTFERLMIGAIFGTRVTHLISGWKSDFQSRDECLEAVEYFLEHTARAQLKFEIGGRLKTMADITMPSYGFSTPAKVCIQAGKFDFLKVLLRYGAEPVVVTNHNQCPLHLLLWRLHTLAESASPEDWGNFLVPPYCGYDVLSGDVTEKDVSRNSGEHEISPGKTSRRNDVTKQSENCGNYKESVNKASDSCESNAESVPKDCGNPSEKSDYDVEQRNSVEDSEVSIQEPKNLAKFSEIVPESCESDLNKPRSSENKPISEEHKDSEEYVAEEPEKPGQEENSISEEYKTFGISKEYVPKEPKNTGYDEYSVSQQPLTTELDQDPICVELEASQDCIDSQRSQDIPKNEATSTNSTKTLQHENNKTTYEQNIETTPQQPNQKLENNEIIFKSAIFPEDLIRCLQVFMSVIPQVPHIIFDNENEPTNLHPAVFSVVPWDRNGWTSASLKHLCRCQIRKCLVMNGCLPYGIYELKLPTQLQRYVDMGD